MKHHDKSQSHCPLAYRRETSSAPQYSPLIHPIQQPLASGFFLVRSCVPSMAPGRLIEVRLQGNIALHFWRSDFSDLELAQIFIEREKCCSLPSCGSTVSVSNRQTRFPGARGTNQQITGTSVHSASQKNIHPFDAARYGLADEIAVLFFRYNSGHTSPRRCRSRNRAGHPNNYCREFCGRLYDDAQRRRPTHHDAKRLPHWQTLSNCRSSLESTDVRSSNKKVVHARSARNCLMLCQLISQAI